MATINLIRRIVPTRLRIKVYVWAISFAGRYKFLLYPFLYLLHGEIPKGITIVNNKPLYHYRNIEIDSPSDSIEAYIEVFHDNVYDHVAVPKEGDVVIDIGAYVGMYSIKASQLVGDTGLVVAVEPLLSNLNYLEKNLRKLSNTKIVKVALSNYIGKGKLYSSPSSAVHSMAYVRDDYMIVRVTTLDELVKRWKFTRIDYIKMDAEGSDILILEGARNVLSKYSPIISAACYHIDANGVSYVDRVINYLESFGYKCITKKGYVYAQKEIK